MFIIINIYSLILRNNKFPSKVLATRSESPLEKDLIEVVEPIFSIGGIKVSSLLVKLYKKSSFVFISTVTILKIYFESLSNMISPPIIAAL